ncbi:FG-GAP-like repeat-containing protein [Maribacter sp. SA7]|uniref:FG-GAP-like repeat-containing protein n=1 Tax=Maribacter zhoushanensis TaxID=3030012 RepID=UPI0023EB616D|nr:FG-GAP-like repeat-containing protein [Maribacter zhoushanensis]MDF4203066.1 FG-GAP-like repeat-containing protein [Maribacter zhoushanensis]
MDFKPVIFFILLCSFLSCNTKKSQKEVVLYETYCASCHMAPSINDLPKHIWKDNVLPEMGARLGIITPEHHPYYKHSFDEQIAIIKTGIYPSRPIIKEEDWKLLADYIVKMAPDSVVNNPLKIKNSELSQFKTKPVTLDSVKGNLYTFLKIDTVNHQILTGNRRGALSAYNLNTKENIVLGNFNQAITDARIVGDSMFITNMGVMDPNEIPRGKTVLRSGSATAVLQDSLHRPVHTLYIDLNNNGNEEIIISEFGNLKGKLTLLEKDTYGFYKNKTLLNLPGSIRVIAKDMDRDGKKDLIVMAAQGDEAIYILYQKENLNFDIDKVLRFNPVYGSSWFELVDYNGDGYDDIITVNGDNADKSIIHKPYHGMRIHINDGSNNFKETYFYPLNGATRVIANDFDKDGDVDFALLATFPDYEKHPDYNIVYLKNENSADYRFTSEHFADTKMGRWFLMDSADIDNDGDEDLVLSALNYSFTPVPEYLNEAWKESYTDLLILENKLH